MQTRPSMVFIFEIFQLHGPLINYAGRPMDDAGGFVRRHILERFRKKDASSTPIVPGNGQAMRRRPASAMRAQRNGATTPVHRTGTGAPSSPSRSRQPTGGANSSGFAAILGRTPSSAGDEKRGTSGLPPLRMTTLQRGASESTLPNNNNNANNELGRQGSDRSLSGDDYDDNDDIDDDDDNGDNDGTPLIRRKLRKDQVVGWGAFPMCYSNFDIVQGRLKVPIMRGEVDHHIDKYEGIQHKVAKHSVIDVVANMDC
jgi:hypothetical protein